MVVNELFPLLWMIVVTGLACYFMTCSPFGIGKLVAAAAVVYSSSLTLSVAMRLNAALTLAEHPVWITSLLMLLLALAGPLLVTAGLLQIDGVINRVAAKLRPE